MRNLRTLITGVGKFIMPRNNSQLMTSTLTSTELNTITARSPLPSQMKENQNMSDTKFRQRKSKMAGPLPLNTETHLHHSLCWVSACLNQCGCTRRYDLMARYFPIYSPGNPGSSPGRKTKVKPRSKCDMPRNT